MHQNEFCEIAERLMSCAAAPYFEAEVIAAVQELARAHKLQIKEDKVGNLMVTAGRQGRGRPIVLAAHLDHPGFEVTRVDGQRECSAVFLGGVGPDYFRKGVKVLLMPGRIPGRLARSGKEKIMIKAKEKLSHAITHAVWDLDDFRLANGRIYGRACDDLIGCACALAAVIEARKLGRPAPLALLSRAEEVGFHGALIAASNGLIPKKAAVYSLETSKEMEPVRMGSGPIIRVGDKSSLFDANATRFAVECAAIVQKREGAFAWQRALMSGGTCEASAFQEVGLQTGALCVALGNYHNCADKHRIAEESVSVADALGLVRLLVEMGSQMGRFNALAGTFNKRIKELIHEARREFAKPRHRL